MKSKMRTFLRRFVITFSFISIFFLFTLTALMLFGVTIDLAFLKGGVESSATSALGRKVAIKGPVVLEFSDWPSLEIQDVQVANVAGATKPFFLSAGLARLEIGIFPLFKGNIEIGEITAEDVSLNLESDLQGEPNWVFGDQEEEIVAPEKASETPAKKSSQKKEDPVGFALNDITLKRIAVIYHDASLDKTIQFKLNDLYGEAESGKPVSLDVEGQLHEQIYDLEFKGGSLEDLLAWGKPWPFRLNGVVAGKTILAEGKLAMRGNEPEADLGFVVKDIDIGAILSRLKLVDGLQASTGSMGIKLSLKGDSLQEIVQRSSMAFSIHDARWRIESPTSDAFLDVQNLNGNIFVEQGNAVTTKLSGRVGEFPVQFIIIGAPLVDYVAVPEKVPLTIDAEFADSVLSFSGELALPVTNRELELSLGFTTASLDNLNDVLRLDLPPFGPVQLETRFIVQSDGYDMPKLDLKVGESRLSGTMNLDMSKEKPDINVELVSELLRLDDFEDIRKKSEAEEQKAAVEELDEGEAEKTAETDDKENGEEKDERNLFSPEVLGSLDADIVIQTKEVWSGEDELGSGMLKVSLHEGRLAVEPLRLDLPGGGLGIAFDYLPTEDDVTANLKAKIDKFDIGILVRHLKPESEAGGSVNLDVALHSLAPDVQSIMEYANGHFDFSLTPENFSSGIIDLWAVNLLSAIMSKITEEEESVINCLVFRLGIENGLMEEKAIYLDTTNMRIAGAAEIDFEFKELDLMLVPKAKNPEFFSLAVPIKIQGDFEDFGLGIGIIRLTGSLFSFITSPIHVPIRRIFTDEIPEDGQEACAQAWTITGEE